MRVHTSKSKNTTHYYIIKTYYATRGIERTITVEKLGTDTEIREKSGKDPAEWARERAAFLTLQEKEAEKDISIPFSPNKLIL